jgi:uncharacterized protein YciI
MLFLVHTWDRPGALDVRLANRNDHFAWLTSAGDAVKAAGPWLDESTGDMAGSLLVVEAEDRAALDAWLAEDPYARAGLFERVEIAPWRWVVNAPTDSAA